MHNRVRDIARTGSRIICTRIDVRQERRYPIELEIFILDVKREEDRVDGFVILSYTVHGVEGRKISEQTGESNETMQDDAGDSRNEVQEHEDDRWIWRSTVHRC